MAMFVAFPSTNMDSTRVEPAPKAPAPLLWRRPKAASILVDGNVANIAMKPTPPLLKAASWPRPKKGLQYG